jgi:tetratricopeptide (TPR) repeat protein
MQQYGQAAPYFAEAEATLRPLGSEQRLAVGAAVELGTVLARLERFEEALEILDRVIDEVGIGGTLPDVSGAVADAMADLIPGVVSIWLTAHERIGRWDEAGSAAEAVIAALDPGTTQKRRVVVAEAFRLLAGAALAQEDWAEALVAWEEVIKRCDGEEDLVFVHMKAQAMGGSAKLLSDLGRVDEALAVCDEVLERFGSVSYEPVREVVTAVRNVKAELLANG